MLLALKDRLAGLEDDRMEHLLQKSLIHQQARLSFWNEQLDKAAEDGKTSDLLAAAKSRA
jgi:hypothetical protein